MNKCVICERDAGWRVYCRYCRAKAHFADRMADERSNPPGTGCALATIIVLVFWVTLAACLLVLL